MHDPDQAAHLLGKLITHVGPKRICWGTDSLWYGSPQAEIVALRRFEFTERGKELYGLPYGLEGDVEDPTQQGADARRARSATGSSAATPRRAYSFDPDAAPQRDHCDEVQALREDGYLASAGTRARVGAARLATQLLGAAHPARGRSTSLTEKPWSP